MQYFEVTQHSLEDARPGLALAEQLLQNDNFAPYLYAITAKSDVLLACEAAIDEDAGEQGVSLGLVALAISFSSDTIQYLAGSGLLLQNEEFAYLSGNDGARVLGLQWSGQRPRVRLTDFSVMALSDSDMDLDEFMKQHGGSAPAETPKTVSREAVPAVKASSKQIINPIDLFLSY